MKELKATCVLSDEPAEFSEGGNDDHNDDNDDDAIMEKIERRPDKGKEFILYWRMVGELD